MEPALPCKRIQSINQSIPPNNEPTISQPSLASQRSSETLLRLLRELQKQTMPGKILLQLLHSSNSHEDLVGVCRFSRNPRNGAENGNVGAPHSSTPHPFLRLLPLRATTPPCFLLLRWLPLRRRLQSTLSLEPPK
jgi:hypothetical protein